MKKYILALLFVASAVFVNAQDDYIVQKGDTLLGQVKLRESSASNKLTFISNNGSKQGFTSDELTAFSHRSIPYRSVQAPVSFTSSYGQIPTDKIKNRRYFAKELVSGKFDLLLIEEYGVQDRFLLNTPDTLIFLPVSNIQQMDTYKGVARRGSSARYFAILKSILWECQEVVEKLYETNYERKSLIELIHAYNTSCSDEPSVINEASKQPNINGFSFHASYDNASLNFDKTDIVPIDLYELGQIDYGNQTAISVGAGYVFMRSKESITSFEGYISYTSIKFVENLVTETDLSHLKAGFSMRLHPIDFGSVKPYIKAGVYGQFFTSPNDTFIEIQNSTVGNTFDGKAVLEKDQYTSPSFGFNTGIGLMYLTKDNKEIGLEFRYDGLLSQIFESITTEYSSTRVMVSFKL